MSNRICKTCGEPLTVTGVDGTPEVCVVYPCFRCAKRKSKEDTAFAAFCLLIGGFALAATFGMAAVVMQAYFRY